ncbi:hypothetical protein B5X24_HaOG211325 [Helicoverpa armigera]|uniref:Uncharacterized protein n=1 Tax=Helicoverpa armigera TaxID=29058 RepID=A0A2W1BF50_HELAM|nr:hypothetical protein B5X24_HaOG211325 [Helicoverpa armigera]
MCCKGVIVFCLFAVILKNATSFPIGLQTPLNCNGVQQLQETGSPIITEIVPSLQFGDVTVTGDLPIGGSIKVKGVFPVYGTVALDGGLPTSGTAVVNTGCGNVV